MEQQVKFRGLVELIGIVAVVASLIFVGLEIRQNAAATRGATQQQLVTGARNVTLTLADNPELAALDVRAYTMVRGESHEDLSAFSEVERNRLGNPSRVPAVLAAFQYCTHLAIENCTLGALT